MVAEPVAAFVQTALDSLQHDGRADGSTPGHGKRGGETRASRAASGGLGVSAMLRRHLRWQRQQLAHSAKRDAARFLVLRPGDKLTICERSGMHNLRAHCFRGAGSRSGTRAGAHWDQFMLERNPGKMRPIPGLGNIALSLVSAAVRRQLPARASRLGTSPAARPRTGWPAPPSNPRDRCGAGDGDRLPPRPSGGECVLARRILWLAVRRDRRRSQRLDASAARGARFGLVARQLRSSRRLHRFRRSLRRRPARFSARARVATLLQPVLAAAPAAQPPPRPRDRGDGRGGARRCLGARRRLGRWRARGSGPAGPPIASWAVGARTAWPAAAKQRPAGRARPFRCGEPPWGPAGGDAHPNRAHEQRGVADAEASQGSGVRKAAAPRKQCVPLPSRSCPAPVPLRARSAGPSASRDPFVWAPRAQRAHGALCAPPQPRMSATPPEPRAA